jgi:hypothetical protein
MAGICSALTTGCAGEASVCDANGAGDWRAASGNPKLKPANVWSTVEGAAGAEGDRVVAVTGGRGMEPLKGTTGDCDTMAIATRS